MTTCTQLDRQETVGNLQEYAQSVESSEQSFYSATGYGVDQLCCSNALTVHAKGTTPSSIQWL